MNIQAVTAFAAATALAFAAAVRADSCDTASLSTVLTSDDATQCTSDSGFDFSSLAAPSGDVTALMCSSTACQAALEEIEALGLGDCTVGSISIESELIEPIVAYCSAANSESMDLSEDEALGTDASAFGSLESESADTDNTEFESSLSAEGSSSEDFDAETDSMFDDVDVDSGSLDFQDLVAGDVDDLGSASDSGSYDVDVGDSSSGSGFSVDDSESAATSTSESAADASESSASASSATASTSSSGSNAGSSLASTSTGVFSAVAVAIVALVM